MADSSFSPEVAARFEKLERESRMLKRVSLVMTIALVAVTAIGAAAGSGALRASQLSIVDSSGVTRVKIDAAGLHLLDSGGKERLSAAFDKKSHEPSFKLFDPRGISRLSVYMVKSDAYLALEDERYTRAILGLVDGKYPQLWFGDSSGTRQMELGMTDVTDSVPFVGLNQKKVQTATLGPYGLSVQDLKAVRRTFVGISSAYIPTLEIFDASKNQRGFLGMYTDGTSGAFLKNASGTATWSVP
ncbi:MAG TPA: hypothetical protein VFO29_02590 [Candidatus Rubrimentiphilum sp.]|nr:hypothetical protein [Candidatus Rubrimentiphilum sp.]